MHTKGRGGEKPAKQWREIEFKKKHAHRIYRDVRGCALRRRMMVVLLLMEEVVLMVCFTACAVHYHDVGGTEPKRIRAEPSRARALLCCPLRPFSPFSVG